MQVPLIIIAVVCASAGLVFAKSILIPFFIALLIAYILSPLVLFLERKLKLPRSLALSATGFVVICAVVFIGLLLSVNIKSMAVHFSDYANRIDLIVAKVTPALELIGITDLGLIQDDLASAITPLLSVAKTVSAAMVDLLADSFLILVFVLFLLSGTKIEFPDTPFLKESDRRIRSYLVTKVMTSLATGFLTWLILWLVGLELSFLFGLLAFFLNFIPTIGSIAAVLLPLPVAILTLENWVDLVAISVLPAFFQFIIGNIIEPKLMGENLDLHPVTLLLALMFWGLLWGVPGMLLAAPLTVIAKVGLAQTRNGRFISELMAGRLV